MNFHLGDGDDGQHYWLTPPQLFESLNEQYAFDFDPLPSQNRKTSTAYLWVGQL